MTTAASLETSDQSERAARERLQRAAGDDFEVGERIGQGGFADVFRATDRRLGRSVVLKVLRADVATSGEAVERFRREARSVAALNHASILPIHAIGGNDAVAFLVLPFVDGESLDDRLEREGVLPVDDAIRLLRELAGALDAAHTAGIVHRDLKPANVLLDGPGGRALLTDFGIARGIGAEDVVLTRTGTFVGTPHYISPEQAAGDASDYRADLYSLGVVGYRMLTGELPFDGNVGSVLVQHLTRTPRPILELCAECPPWLAEIVHRCLAKSPEERWPSAAELLRALDGPAAARMVQATLPEGPATVDGRTRHDADARGLRRVALTAGAIALLAVALDVVITGGLTFSLLVLVLAAAAVANAAVRLWVQGIDPLLALRGRAELREQQDADELGRHAAIVRSARSHRTLITRSLSEMPNAERARVAPVAAAADELVARVLHLTRRMASIDESVTQRLAGSSAQARARGRFTPELFVARARLEQDVARAHAVLESLAAALGQPGSAGGEARQQRIAPLLLEAEQVARGSAQRS